MDSSHSAPATTPAKAQPVLVLQGGGALGSYQAGAYQALCHLISSRNGSPAFRSAPSTPPSSPAIERDKRVERLKEFWDMVSPPVSWIADRARRSRALAVQRDQCRDRSRPLACPASSPRASAGAALAAGQPAGAELLRHRAAEDDAGAAGRFRPDQRSARRGCRVGAVSVTSGNFAYFDNFDSGSAARRSAPSTSWPPARCRRAFRPSSSTASPTGMAASSPTRRWTMCWMTRQAATC